jgi:maltoporin
MAYINSNFYVSSLLFFKPENIMWVEKENGQGVDIKVRLVDYFMWNERVESNGPMVSHVSYSYILIRLSNS